MSVENKKIIVKGIAKKSLKFPISAINFLSNHDGILMRNYGWKIFFDKPITNDPELENTGNSLQDLQELKPEIPENIDLPNREI